MIKCKIYLKESQKFIIIVIINLARNKARMTSVIAKNLQVPKEFRTNYAISRVRKWLKQKKQALQACYWQQNLLLQVGLVVQGKTVVQAKAMWKTNCGSFIAQTDQTVDKY